MSHNAAITQIMEQCEDGDLEGVRAKLKIQPALLNIRDGNGRSPLHRAAESGNMELMEMLIGMGAIVNAESETGHTPLHFGAFAGHVDACKSLLNNGAWIDHMGTDGCVPLHFACGQGKLAVIEFLVSKGANLKIANYKGQLPLHWAVQNKHNDVAKAVNAMYTARPKNLGAAKAWPRPKGDKYFRDVVDNGSDERAMHNKHMGIFFDASNTTVRSHNVSDIEKEEVTSLLDTQHSGMPV